MSIVKLFLLRTWGVGCSAVGPDSKKTLHSGSIFIFIFNRTMKILLDGLDAALHPCKL